MHHCSDSVAKPKALECMFPRSFGFDRPSPCRRRVYALIASRCSQTIAQGGIGTSLRHPGKPSLNGTDESFNGKFRSMQSDDPSHF